MNISRKLTIDGKEFKSAREASRYLKVGNVTLNRVVENIGYSFSSKEFYKNTKGCRPFAFKYEGKTYTFSRKSPIKSPHFFIETVKKIDWGKYIYEDEAKKMLGKYFLSFKELSRQKEYTGKLRHPYITNLFLAEGVKNYKPRWAYDIVENGYGSLGGIFRLRWDELKPLLPPFLSESKKYLQERRWVDYSIHSIIKIVWKYYKSEIEFLSKKEVRYGRERLVYPCWKINSIIDEVRENGLDFYVKFNSEARHAIYFNSESYQYRTFAD